MKPKGYWNKENCKKAASECSSIKEFEEKYRCLSSFSEKRMAE